MKNPIFQFLLFFVLYIQNTAVAQYEVTKYDVSNGLMHENVLGVWQDKEGYIWVADEMGFSRINGDEIINYWLPDGLVFNYSTIFKQENNVIKFKSFMTKGVFKNGKYSLNEIQNAKEAKFYFTDFKYKINNDTLKGNIGTIDKFYNNDVLISLKKQAKHKINITKNGDTLNLDNYNLDLFKPYFINIDFLKISNPEFFQKESNYYRNDRVINVYLSKILKEDFYTYFIEETGNVISIDTSLNIKKLDFDKYHYIKSIFKDRYNNFYLITKSSKEILYINEKGELIKKINVQNFNNGRCKFVKTENNTYFIDRINNNIYLVDKGEFTLLLKAKKINNIKILKNKLYCIDKLESDLIVYEILTDRVSTILSKSIDITKWIDLSLIDREGVIWMRSKDKLLKFKKSQVHASYIKKNKKIFDMFSFLKHTYRYKGNVIQIIETFKDTTYILSKNEEIVFRYNIEVLGNLSDSVLLITSKINNKYKLGKISINEPSNITFFNESFSSYNFRNNVLTNDKYLFEIEKDKLIKIDSISDEIKRVVILKGVENRSDYILCLTMSKSKDDNKNIIILKRRESNAYISVDNEDYRVGFMNQDTVYVFYSNYFKKYDNNGLLIDSISLKEDFYVDYFDLPIIGNYFYDLNESRQLVEYNLRTDKNVVINKTLGIKYVDKIALLDNKLFLLLKGKIFICEKKSLTWEVKYLLNINDLLVGEKKDSFEGFYVTENTGYYFFNYEGSIYTYNKNFKAPFTTLNIKFRTISYYNSEKELITTDTNLVDKNQFNHTHKNVSIRMETITNFHAETVVYHYQLLGSETDKWFEIKTDSVMFSNLNVGTYTFNFWSENGFDVKSETKSYSFTILPPWYNTWWARTLYVLIGGLLVFGFVRSRTAKLKKRQAELEHEVELATVEIKEQKQEVEQQRDKAEHLKVVAENQKELVEEKNKEILDSITYAKRIQNAILPPPRLVKEWLNDSFIFYKPKDIVAGDFYWMEVVKRDGRNIIFYAAADCTGHGVPGAMVSVVCSNALNRSVKEFNITDPAKLLDKVTELVKDSFEQSEESIKDGMDIAICALDLVDRKVWFAGAHNPLYRITDLDTKVPDDLRILEIENRKLVEYKADKQPVGEFEYLKPFTTTEIQLEPGDCIYIFSDGFADQFGGEKNKKYKSANFKKFLMHIESKDMDAQKEMLDVETERWRGEIEQLDDICVIGLRVNGHMRKIFTNRELEIMEKVIGGKTSKIIGEELFISKHTVDTHRKRIMAKSNSKNATELIVFCKHHEIGF